MIFVCESGTRRNLLAIALLGALLGVAATLGACTRSTSWNSAAGLEAGTLAQSGGGGTSSSGAGGASSSGSGGSSGGSGDGWTHPAVNMNPAQPQLWVFAGMYMSQWETSTEIQNAENLLSQAAQAGYTGVVFYDSSYGYILTSGWSTVNQQIIINYAQSLGLQMVMPAASTGPGAGMANDSVIGSDPNLSESVPVTGTQYKVVSGSSGGLNLQVINSVTPSTFGGGDFENGMLNNFGSSLTEFGYGDPEVSLDSTASHCYAGNACAHISAGGSGANERLYHALSLTPNREYHLSMMIKAQNAAPDPSNPWWRAIYINENDASGNEVGARLSANFPTDTGGAWQQFDYVFNSKGIANATLIMGVWGGLSAGDIWIDNVQLEEIGLYDIVRRTDAPLKLYDPGSGTVYTEGTDFQPVSDSAFLSQLGNVAYASGSNPPDSNNTATTYHAPPTVSIIATSPTAPVLGQTLAANYEAVTPFYIDTYSQSWVAMSEPGMITFNQTWAQALSALFPPGVGYFMGYDEFRQTHNSAAEHAQYTSAGALLAANAQAMTNMLVGQNGVRPGAPAYVWSDMFDEHANGGHTYPDAGAGADYYYTDDSNFGAWAGLPSYVTIFNWHSPAGEGGDPQGNLADSLSFFAGLSPDNPTPHAQIISGYYDCGCNGATQAQLEMSYAAGVPGVIGMMYTTWADDYSQMAAYAQGAKAAWVTYKASLPQ